MIVPPSAVFCFGSIVHMGIQAFALIYYYVDHYQDCYDPKKAILLVIRSLYSFYQLFMAFKYQNVASALCWNTYSLGHCFTDPDQSA